MGQAFASVLAVTFLVAGWVSTGEAGAINGGRQLPIPEALRAEWPTPFPRPSPPPGVFQPPATLSPRAPSPSRQERATPRERSPQHWRRPGRPGIVIPSTVYVTVPRVACWTPGYWTHQWVPATTTSHVWVPEHWTADGRWMPGHYAALSGSGGSWHPVWIPDTWTSC